jgi:hypothetical protein
MQFFFFALPVVYREVITCADKIFLCLHACMLHLIAILYCAWKVAWEQMQRQLVLRSLVSSIKIILPPHPISVYVHARRCLRALISMGIEGSRLMPPACHWLPLPWQPLRRLQRCTSQGNGLGYHLGRPLLWSLCRMGVCLDEGSGRARSRGGCARRLPYRRALFVRPAP